jgi:endonuclease/exonuclease/phosphatase family metal-dependent hydrolase
MLVLTWSAIVLAHGQEFPVRGAPRFEAPREVFAYGDACYMPSNRIRIAFYNIENFTDGKNDGPFRTSARALTHAREAAALIDEIDPDILLLAEIENDQALRMLNKHLAQPYPLGYITRYDGHDGATEKLQNALLSRFAPLETVEIDFGAMSGPGRPPRGALRVSFELDENRRLIIYVTHLKSNYGHRDRNMYKRKHALQHLAKDARALMRDQSIHWEVLLIGDFNVDPDLPEFADDWSLSPLNGWADLWRGAPIHARVTLPTRYGDPMREFPPASFDRIFAAGDATNAPWRVGAPGVLQRGVNVRNVFVKPGEEGHISDHYPVWVDLFR